MPPIVDNPAAYNSENDNNSDSEWLDIASSGDTDSLSALESDSIDGRGPSRRSSISNVSLSEEEEADRWEGLQDSASDSERDVVASSPEVPPTTRATISLSDIGADSEDERVNTALDQSMCSTLSSSRTSSRRTSGSTVDLRLSFPDPLSTSHDSLGTTYESFNSHQSADTVLEDPALDLANVTFTSSFVHSADPGSFSTPDVPEEQPTHEEQFPSFNAVFEIVMYGSSSSDKWSFVDLLLRKASSAFGVVFPPHTISPCERVYPIQSNDNNGCQRAVRVIDACVSSTEPKASPTAPHSLGLIFLPSSPPSTFLFEHTMYLPIVSISGFTEGIVQEAASYSWDNWEVPRAQVLEMGSDRIVTMERLEAMADYVVVDVFHRLLTSLSPKADSDSHAHAVTMMRLFHLAVLLLSVVLGYFSYTALPSFSPSTPGAHEETGAIMQRTPNLTTSNAVPAALTNASAALIPSSFRSLALAVLAPQKTGVASYQSQQGSSQAQPSLSCTTKKSDPAQSTATSSAASTSKNSRHKVVQSSPELLDASGPILTIDAGQSETTAFSIASSGESAFTSSSTSETSLSINLLASIAEILQTELAAIIGAVGKDVQEILSAIDELIASIHQSIAVVMSSENRRSMAESLSEHIRHRHQHARDNAQRLTDYATTWLSSIGSSLSVPMNRARERAKGIKDVVQKSIENSQVWASYERQRHREEARLRKDGRKAEGHRTKERRFRLRAA